MNPYYLMAQLPSLDGIGEGPLPMTEEQLDQLCAGQLNKKALAILRGLTLAPGRRPEPSGSSLVDAWNGHERGLRLALGRARAARMGKAFPTEEPAPEGALSEAARRAVELADPMEAELYLTRERLAYLETLRPADAFCEDTLFYYALRLKLLSRLRCFDAAAGEQAYRTIYRSVLDGARTEETL